MNSQFNLPFFQTVNDNREKSPQDAAVANDSSSSSATDNLNNNNNPVPSSGRKSRKSTPPARETPRDSPRPPAPQPESSHVHIPPFYYPLGQPPPRDEAEAIAQRIADAFNGLDGGKAYKHQMGTIAMVGFGRSGQVLGHEKKRLFLLTL